MNESTDIEFTLTSEQSTSEMEDLRKETEVAS